MGQPLKTGEIEYTVSVSPNPLVVVAGITFNNTKLSASVTDVPNLSVTLVPKFSWNPVNAVLTIIGSLANAFKGKISDRIKKEVVGKSIDIVTVPDIPLSHEGIGITLSPSNLSFSKNEGFLMITGDYTIS